MYASENRVVIGSSIGLSTVRYHSLYQTLQQVLNQNAIIFIWEIHWKILHANILSDPNISHTYNWTYVSFNAPLMLELWWLNDTTAGNLSQMNFIAYMMCHMCIYTMHIYHLWQPIHYDIIAFKIGWKHKNADFKANENIGWIHNLPLNKLRCQMW